MPLHGSVGRKPKVVLVRNGLIYVDAFCCLISSIRPDGRTSGEFSLRTAEACQFATFRASVCYPRLSFKGCAYTTEVRSVVLDGS